MGTKSGRRKPERKPILSTKEYQEILDSIRKQIEVGNTAEADVQTRALRLLEHIVSERAKASDSEGRKSAQIRKQSGGPRQGSTKKSPLP